MPDENLTAWGWRIPFLLSFFVIIAGYIIRRKVDELPHLPKRASMANCRGHLSSKPFRLSWADMLRVVCMALMNVIPVVATIFGAAYAVQPAYGIGFQKDIYLCILVLGNILAVLVIPLVGNLIRQDRPAGPPSSSVRSVSGLLSFGYLYAISNSQCAAGDHHVSAHVGCRLPRL